jgi:hypothetical protein
MFPAIMLKVSDVIIVEKKTLLRKIITAMIWVVMQDARIVLLYKAQDFVRVGERGIGFIVLAYFLLIYRTSTVDGITLRILSLCILVPH